MSDSYFTPEELARFGEIGEHAPELAKDFFRWYGAVFEEGALTPREKALVGLGVAHAIQCAYCIDSFSKKALETGSDVEQMTEAVHVAAAVRGGATLVHGMQMRKRADKLSM